MSPAIAETLHDSDQTAEQQIQAAWRTYQSVERHGLEFGQVCYEWQQKLAERGQRVKGRGVVPILEQLGIPISTAYYWIGRYRATFEQLDDAHEKPSPKAVKGSVPKPNSDEIEKAKEAAQRLQDACKKAGMNVEISPSRETGKFHLTYRNLSEVDIQQALGSFQAKAKRGAA